MPFWILIVSFYMNKIAEIFLNVLLECLGYKHFRCLYAYWFANLQQTEDGLVASDPEHDFVIGKWLLGK